MTALILQARLDSSRLPGKSLLPLGGKALVSRVMEALNQINCDVRILACPGDCVSQFSPLAEETGFELVPGPKEDVLARFCKALKFYKPDRIIRATGDNPFVLIDAANLLDRETRKLNADYGLYTDIPHGTGVECVLADALLRAEREAKLQAEREHVCPYLYNHPEIFKLHITKAPSCWQGAELNCTVDTDEDYKRAIKLYSALDIYTGEERYKGENIIYTYKKLF